MTTSRDNIVRTATTTGIIVLALAGIVAGGITTGMTIMDNANDKTHETSVNVPVTDPCQIQAEFVSDKPITNVKLRADSGVEIPCIFRAVDENIDTPNTTTSVAIANVPSAGDYKLVYTTNNDADVDVSVSQHPQSVIELISAKLTETDTTTPTLHFYAWSPESVKTLEAIVTAQTTDGDNEMLLMDMDVEAGKTQQIYQLDANVLRPKTTYKLTLTLVTDGFTASRTLGTYRLPADAS